LLKERLKQANDAYWTEQVAIQEEAAGGFLALVEGRKEDAIAAIRHAADLEDQETGDIRM